MAGFEMVRRGQECVCVCVCEREAAQDRHRAEAQKEEFKLPAEGNIRLSFKFLI